MRTGRTAMTMLGIICVAAGVCGAADLSEKKLIAVGWDMPNAERLRANYELMDQLPFRGSSLRFTGRGNTPFLDFAHGRDEWKPEDIAQIIEDLAAAKPERLTHNFLDIKATPGDVDWFDDEGWAIIVDHWRTAARVAKEGGIAGILFDPESYRNAQFGYKDQSQADQHTFDEYRAMARKRGGEVMAAVTEEHPDITILSLFMLSIFGPQIDQPTPALATSRYGLYPAFIDGWLDTVGERVTLVDGCESAYHYNSDVEHLAAANLIRNRCQRLISPENRYRYRAQVQVGFGIYLDAYANPPESSWYIDPGDQTPVERLEANLISALNAADEYVWLYGEQASWWPSPHARADAVRWGEKLPGVEEMFWSVIEPTLYAARLIEETGDAENLLQNAHFDAAEGEAAPGAEAADWQTEGAPSGWSFWQSAAAGSEGNPGWDGAVGHDAPGSATMTAVRSGCLIGSAEVTPGRRYAVSVWQRQTGEGHSSVRVRWKTEENKWHAEHEDRFLTAHGTDGDWQQMIGVVSAPEGTKWLVILLSMDGQQTEEDVAWWDDVKVFEVR
ncbi:MAG: hypothetical protein GX131_18655 [candidate division WS1 bacterium]|nr:hypothetical protein [candidate division WS1 bacterium]